MNESAKRAVGYGATAVVIGGLVWAGFVYETDPDLMTMVSSVDVQLRMASAMPSKGEDGAPLREREDLLAMARDYLDRIDRVKPGFPQAREYRAYLAYLEHDFERAARLYREVRALEGVTPTERDHAVLNEARMLRMSGDDQAAVALLRKHEGSFLPENAALVKRELGEAVGAAEADAAPGDAGEAATVPATPASPAPGTGR